MGESVGAGLPIHWFLENAVDPDGLVGPHSCDDDGAGAVGCLGEKNHGNEKADNQETAFHILSGMG